MQCKNCSKGNTSLWQNVFKARASIPSNCCTATLLSTDLDGKETKQISKGCLFVILVHGPGVLLQVFELSHLECLDASRPETGSSRTWEGENRQCQDLRDKKQIHDQILSDNE